MNRITQSFLIIKPKHVGRKATIWRGGAGSKGGGKKNEVQCLGL